MVLLALLACGSELSRGPQRRPEPASPPVGSTSDTAATVDTVDTGVPPTAPRPLGRGADIDGDGFDDLVASAPYLAPGGTIYVFAGGATLDDEAVAWVEGLLPGALLGPTLDVVGDLDADGYADLAANSEYTSPRAEFVSVWFGGPLFTLDGPLELEEPVATNFGRSIGGVGDADGDGVDDMVIGTITGNLLASGQAWLISGQAGGFDGTRRTELVTAHPGPYFGHGSAGAGDLDGDGLRDVLVSAFTFEGTGSVEVFLGAVPVDGAPDGEVIAQVGYDRVASAGDFDGDGRADALIAANLDDADVGTVWLHLGTHAGLDPVAASEHAIGGRTFFGDAIAGCGDVDGDGAPDVVVGEPYSDVAGRDGGAAHVVFGGDAADLEPDVLLTGDGRKMGGALGAIDANADGYGDIVVSSAWYYGDRPDAVLVYFGGPTFDVDPEAVFVGADTDAEFGTAVLRGIH